MRWRHVASWNSYQIARLMRKYTQNIVSADTLASQQLAPGDVVLAIQGKPAHSMRHDEAILLVRTAGLTLEITLHKPPASLLQPPVRRHSGGATDNRVRTTASPVLHEVPRRASFSGTVVHVNIPKPKFDTIPESQELNRAVVLKKQLSESEISDAKCTTNLPDLVPEVPDLQREDSPLPSSIWSADTDSRGLMFQRQSSQLSGGGASPVTPAETGGSSAPPPPPPMPAPITAGGPPPPPPPPMPTGVPAVRLGSEIESRGSRLGPPLAIQAAMGKDKKPFTYTPGGIDLSEIRSPRMQRRICRNAAAEGVSTTPAPSNAAVGVTPANALPMMPPQIAVPVLPPPPPPQPPQHSPMKATTPVAVKVSPTPPPAQNNSNNNKPQQQATISVRPPPPPNFPPPNFIKNNVVNNNPEPTMVVNLKKTSPTSVYIPSQQPQANAVSQPGHIYVAPVAPKESAGGQLGSLYIPPVTQAAQTQQVKSQTPPPQSPGSPIHSALSKAPMPWMNSQIRQTPAQSPPVGLWSPPPPPSTPPSNGNSVQQAASSNTRIIPIHVEGRDAPVCPSNVTAQQQSTGSRTRIVPIQIEGASEPQQQRRPGPVYTHNKFAQDQNNTSQSPTPQTPMTPGTPSHGRSSVPSTPMSPTPGPTGAPVQSRSFRVLQKITASEEDDTKGGVPQAAAVSQTGPPPPPPAVQQQQQQQQRKLLLTNEDRQLMDRFRAQDLGPSSGYLGHHVQSGHPQDEDEQATRLLYRGANIPSRVFRLLDQSVDEDTFLHTEADPRYRGAAIPSRAFRMLQTMTDTGPPASVPGGAPQMYQGGRPDVSSPQSGGHESGMQQQVYVPASEQGAQPEPRKYTGSCIPSRSFRMLQAMTAPENCGPGQSDL